MDGFPRSPFYKTVPSVGFKTPSFRAFLTGRTTDALKITVQTEETPFFRTGLKTGDVIPGTGFIKGFIAGI